MAAGPVSPVHAGVPRGLVAPRRRRWGALLWGLVGALLGQIQLGGFLFASAFLLPTLVLDRKIVAWRYWIAGSLIGSLPMLPWMDVLLANGPGLHGGALHSLQPYFAVGWFDLALGTDLKYSLGRSFHDFLAYPSVAGTGTYLGTALLLTSTSLGAIVAARLLLRLWHAPRAVAARVCETRSSTATAVIAGFFCYGILLTLTLRPFHLHYLIVAFCLPALSLAWLGELGTSPDRRSRTHTRRILLAAVLCQALTTMLFLSFIHTTRVIHGDYGTVYRAQP